MTTPSVPYQGEGGKGEGGREGRGREGGGRRAILHVLYHFSYFDLLVMIYQLLLVLISSINLFNVILTY